MHKTFTIDIRNGRNEQIDQTAELLRPIGVPTRKRSDQKIAEEVSQIQLFHANQNGQILVEIEIGRMPSICIRKPDSDSGSMLEAAF